MVRYYILKLQRPRGKHQVGTLPLRVFYHSPHYSSFPLVSSLALFFPIVGLRRLIAASVLLGYWLQTHPVVPSGIIWKYSKSREVSTRVYVPISRAQRFYESVLRSSRAMLIAKRFHKIPWAPKVSRDCGSRLLGAPEHLYGPASLAFRKFKSRICVDSCKEIKQELRNLPIFLSFHLPIFLACQGRHG